ncbi:MAG: hypothetical protein H8D26_09050 [Methanomicrobia archaeon]|nr:hypothetical protein [Methanomicrobia archaeon]
MEKAEGEIEKFKARIEDVKVYTDKGYFVEKYDRCHEISDLWEERPGLLHGDTDIMVVTVELLEGEEKGKKVTETFNALLKYDGTLELNAQSSINRNRRRIVKRFLKHYKLIEDVKKYDILGNIDGWVGKEVVVFLHDGEYRIFVPAPSQVRFKKPILVKPIFVKPVIH